MKTCELEILTCGVDGIPKRYYSFGDYDSWLDHYGPTRLHPKHKKPLTREELVPGAIVEFVFKRQECQFFSVIEKTHVIGVIGKFYTKRRPEKHSVQIHPIKLKTGEVFFSNQPFNVNELINNGYLITEDLDLIFRDSL